MTFLSRIFHCFAFPGFTFFPHDLEVGTVDPLGEEELRKRVRSKRALVVGGTSGIGRGIAEALATFGASVVVVGSSSKRGQQAVDAMEAAVKSPAEQTFQAIAADLLTVKGCVAMTKQLSGCFDFVVFTVGVWPDKEDPQTTDGVDKVVALDVLARFVITEEIKSLLSSDARVMSVLASCSRVPPAPKVEIIKQLITGEKTSYLSAQMLSAAGTAMDNWLQHAPARHPGICFIGTFPGIVGTQLIVTSKTLPACLRPIVGRVQSWFAMTPKECGMNHLQVLLSSNANQRSTTYFNTIRLEGRKTDPLAYDSEFGKWLGSFLEDKASKLK